jgi:3-methyladenine DNA glycosylase/8-oxoguanine DNA glycosylase
VRATEAEALAEAWRPWRSYATLHLWHAASDAKRDDAMPEAGTL